MEKTLILCVNFNDTAFDFTEVKAEALALVDSAGFNSVEIISCNRQKADSKLFVGSGKVEELKTLILNLEIEVLYINHNITPVQERNLSQELNIRVLDRTALILGIFESRVSSFEGKLQVEIATLSYQMTRLVRRWSHLERQKGGIGLRGGPGETQMELDRRMIKDKIKILKDRLSVAIKQRNTQRNLRTKKSTKTISLVGYTNAGKSTLFNALTNAQVYVKDRLFATLETTTRKLFLPQQGEIIISDTVGFIHDLPHGLVAAFRATLEETVYADLLLHVIDFSNHHHQAQISAVNMVLEEINGAKIPYLLVYNKIDLVADAIPHTDYNQTLYPYAVYLSSSQKSGLEILRQAIIDKFNFLTSQPLSVEKIYEPWKFK